MTNKQHTEDQEVEIPGQTMQNGLKTRHTIDGVENVWRWPGHAPAGKLTLWFEDRQEGSLCPPNTPPEKERLSWDLEFWKLLTFNCLKIALPCVKKMNFLPNN